MFIIKVFLIISYFLGNCMADVKIEELPSPKCILGEGPHWDIETQNLYYIDIYGSPAIFRYSYAENKFYSAVLEGESAVSFIVPVEGTTNEFAVGLGRRIGIISWDGVSPNAKLVRIAAEVEQNEKYKTNRFNDGKTDPSGRLYAGTMRLEECGDLFEKREGNFYKYNATTKGFDHLIDDIGISNGLAFNEKTKKMYYIDSCDLNVKEFDYDPKTGNITNGKILAKIGEKNVLLPDGMTIDNEGFLYVATWGGSKVVKLNPKNGETVMEIKLPCEQVTSAAFGGPNLDILYITTAATDRDKPQSPSAGKLFKVTGLNAKGTVMPRARF